MEGNLQNIFMEHYLNWVLSAAHCFQELITVGLKQTFSIYSFVLSRVVIRIINHPNYSSPPYDNDIALVQLSSSVNFSDYIRPVCLAAAGSTFAAGTESWVTGWGRLQSEGG
uniref:Peptidase S1 domain-containing protein n=1 Tax=Cyprinus carpio carpio TaxID=630221 RepID=A0A8C1DY02_CYPCA